MKAVISLKDDLKPGQNLWRAGLPALGREAALKPERVVCQVNRGGRVCDCFAAERGQARSPQDRVRF